MLQSHISCVKNKLDSSFVLIKTLFFSHQNFNYLCTPTDDGFIPRVTVNPDFSFGAVRKAVAEIKDRLEEFGREELLKISKSGLTMTAETQYFHRMDRNPPKTEFTKHKCVLSYSE